MRSLPLPDCSSADHDYVFGGAWSYIRPDCRTLGVSDVVTKGKDSVSFTTSTTAANERIFRNCSSQNVLHFFVYALE